MSLFTPLVKVDANDDHAASRVVPYDQVSGTDVFNTVTGGSWSLVDRGGGQWAWRLSAGAALTVTAESSTASTVISVNPGAGDVGIVMVVRAAFTSVPTSSSSRPRIGWLSSSNEGIRWARNGSNSTGFNADWGFNPTSASTNLGTGLVTAAIRFDVDRALDGFDVISKWEQGGSGSTPDGTSTPAGRNGATLSKLQCQVSDTGVYELTDFYIWREAGLGATFTDTVMRSLATDLAGTLSAPSGPTIDTQPTAQTVNEPAAATFTVAATTSGGSLTYQWQRANPGSGSFSNVGGATSASYVTPATASDADHGAQYRCNVTDSNGTTATSAAGLTVRAVTTTSRPAADVDTAGWTASMGTNFATLIGEGTYSLTDYIDSPTITSTPDWATFDLDYPRATGDHVLPVWASVPGGAGTLKVRLENDAATVVGSAADQAVTGTATRYDLPITISGPATRISYAFVT